MTEVEGPLRESSEECAIQLHHYTPQDEMDKRIFCLFINKKSNPKEPFEALRENNLNNNKNNSNELDEDLREIMRAIIQKAIEEYNWLIFGINF
ncbi:hypothetical protein Glove_139g384 [Diversispora epigaea]|uniref:Uncharacterized protein n=1 Tax=Diversispora epigaea TaxID=1348612 RepID=A0A397IYM7_9GLOM|nr:hypothetical protein Glove_139g384 [Diversispora epigaea]